jgi:hypothetical protein
MKPELLYGLSILLGCIVYMLDKFKEQKEKYLSEGKTFGFVDFMLDSSTIISFVTSFLMNMGTSFIVIGDADQGNNMWMIAGVLFMTAYGGSSATRKRMTTASYISKKKQGYSDPDGL